MKPKTLGPDTSERKAGTLVFIQVTDRCRSVPSCMTYAESVPLQSGLIRREQGIDDVRYVTCLQFHYKPKTVQHYASLPRTGAQDCRITAIPDPANFTSTLPVSCASARSKATASSTRLARGCRHTHGMQPRDRNCRIGKFSRNRISPRALYRHSKILKIMKGNGFPAPEFKSDDGRTNADSFARS
jgi:hypothetical protein